jgi:hypothetical protein
MKGVCAVIFYLCVLNAERMPSPGRPQGLILRLRSCVQINVSSCSSVAMRSTHLLDQYVKYIPAANAGDPHPCNLDQSPYGGETGGGNIIMICHRQLNDPGHTAAGLSSFPCVSCVDYRKAIQKVHSLATANPQT